MGGIGVVDWSGIVENIEDYFGFVYQIERLNAQPGEPRYYIGKKNFLFKKTLPPLKGFKRKRKSVIDSDWREYYGSSKYLLADIEKHGKDQFKRTILAYAGSKWELSYLEAEFLMQAKAMYRPDYYNYMILLKLGKAPKNLRIWN